MSPINRAGSASEIPPRHSFLRKNVDEFIREAGRPGYRDLGFHFSSMRVSFKSKVTGIDKATIATNDTSLCSTILALFLEFHPDRPG